MLKFFTLGFTSLLFFNLYAQEIKRTSQADLHYDIQHILTEKQTIRTQENNLSTKSSDLKIAEKNAPNGTHSRSKTEAILEKIAYLKALACCKDEIENLQSQLNLNLDND